MKHVKVGIAALAFFSLFPVCYADAETMLPGKSLGPFLSGRGINLGAPVDLTADKLEFNDETGVAVAEGNVSMAFGNRTLRAEKIRYDSRSGEAELTGHVHYKEAGDEFSFDRITLNLESELGILYNGSIRIGSRNYQISSEKFEKTGLQTFRVARGTLTTCPYDPEPDWKFEVGDCRVTIDGYAVARDVTFRVRGVPVLWLPWTALPVKLTRQSGLLVPGFSSSPTKGFSVQLPLYWAINRWSDATATFDYMSRRGLRSELEYRYVLDPRSEGEARFSMHDDRVTASDRYRFEGSNALRSGERWYSNARWDLVSDDQYFRDMVDPDILRTARHVASRGFVGRSGGDAHTALSLVWVTDLQGIPDDNTVQRLPEITGTFLPGSLGKTGIDFSGDVGLTYFHRRDDTREGRARGAGELSRTFTLHPSVTFTPFLSLDLMAVLPTDGRDGSGKAGRVLPGAGASLDAGVFRNYEGKGGRLLVHTVQGIVGFRWIPLIDQSDIRITDQWSRVGEQQQFTFSLNQRFIRFDDKTGPSELAYLSLEWALDAGGRRSTGSPYIDPLSPNVRSLRDQVDLGAGRIPSNAAASDIHALFQLRPYSKWRFSGELLVDTQSWRFTTASVGSEWKQREDMKALLEYRLSRDLSEDVHGLVVVRPLRIFGLRTEGNYSIKNKEMNEGSATLTLYPRSDCWGIGLTASRTARPPETSYKLTFSLKGIGTVGK
jgi:LPS-assembly protein